MKKVIFLPIIVIVLFFALSAMRSPASIVTLTISNGTAYKGYCTISGNQINLNPSSATSTQLATSTYNITLHTDAPGTHQFFVPNQAPVNSASGTVSFFAVNITASSSAGIH